MDSSKLELYDSHGNNGSNGLADLMPSLRRASSVTASETDSEEENDRDVSKKRKRPMNVTYVHGSILISVICSILSRLATSQSTMCPTANACA